MPRKKRQPQPESESESESGGSILSSSGSEFELSASELESSDDELHGDAEDLDELQDDQNDDDTNEDDEVVINVDDIRDQSDKDIAEVVEQIRRCETVLREMPADDERLYDGNLYPPEFYQQGIENMDIEAFRRKVYAKGTEKQIKNSENQWRLFCVRHMKKDKDWVGHLSTLDFRVIYQFLHWHLAQRTGKGGRKKRCIKKRSSLITFWCCFRLVYERALYVKIDEILDHNLIHNALADLTNKFDLTHEPRENRSMTLEDLKAQIRTTLSTTEKMFGSGEQRILAVLFLLLLAPQGSRPSSILALRFGDIEVLLVRNPTTPKGPPRLVIRLSLEYTKQYMGPKSTKHFVIPEIIYDPSLLLSPHVFLLAILFRNQAFSSHGLNSNPHILSELKIHPSTNQLPLTLRPQLRDVHVFRRAENTISGYQTSDKPIGYDMMAKWVLRIGILLGFKNNTICYSLRYMAGNNLDQNVNVSDALRNLIMDHAPNSDTFQKHYLNRNVVADLWAIHRNHEPQQALIQQTTSHGHSRNSRRPIKLTIEQKNAVLGSDPRYRELTEQLAVLPSGPKFADERREISLERGRLRKSLELAELKRVRTEFDRQQAIEDIERQVRGEDIGKQSAEHDRVVQPMGRLQRNMFSAVTTPLPASIDEITQRRTNAIDALIAYCLVEEPFLANVAANVADSKRKRETGQEVSRKRTTIPQAPAPPAPLEPKVSRQALVNSVFVKSMGKVKVRRCFICVAKALTLEPDSPNYDKLCHEFNAMTNLGNHFLKLHVALLDDTDSVDCPFCRVKLDDKMYLRNHVEVTHRLKSIKNCKLRK